MVFLFGCSEEATKLEVEKLANWEITNIEDEYRVRLDSVLNISPIINDEILMLRNMILSGIVMIIIH